MRTGRRIALAATLGIALLPGSALAASAGSIKDERASGSLYPAASYARCDVLSLKAEKTRSTLVVTVGLRGKSPFGSSVTLHVNTKGGPASDPEYQVDSSGDVRRSGDFRSMGTAGIAISKSGKVVTIDVPLAAIGKPRGTVAVQVQTCGEGAVDIAPGKHHFDDRSYDGTIEHRYLTAAKAERTIRGTVMVRCAGKKSCRRLAVKGAVVTAKGGGRTFTGVSDQKGRYELAVKRGVYTVGARADMRITTKAKRLNLRSKKSGTANFDACGLTPGAGASAVGGGVWKGGNRDCLNAFEISWRPSSSSLSISWVSIPVCTAVGGNYTGPAKILRRGELVDPSRQGENLVVGANEVGFFHPILSVHSGNNVNGKLKADGSGTVSARYVEGLCTYSIANLRLKRG